VPASDRDLAHVRRAFAEFNKRYDSLRDDGALERYHAEFYAPDSVIEHVDNFPAPGRYEGSRPPATSSSPWSASPASRKTTTSSSNWRSGSATRCATAGLAARAFI